MKKKLIIVLAIFLFIICIAALGWDFYVDEGTMNNSIELAVPLFNKKENYKGYAIKNEFVGSDWLFIDKIDFLIDDDEVITFNVEPNRKVNKLFTVSCTENSINTVSSEFIDKILNAKTVKVKICGKSNFIKFDLTPLHKYQIATAKYYYDNDIIPAN